MSADSADGDLFREAIAGKQLEGSMQGKLFRMPRGSLSTDNHLSLDFLDDEVADPPVGELANLGFNPLGQARSRLEIV
jgi:hypothetical protein